MTAASDIATLEWIRGPRIPIRGLLGYGLFGAFQVRSEESPADREDERRAIEGSKRGDPEAFDLLVRRYSRRVLSIVWNVLRDPSAAEDITQDAFVRAYETMGRFRPDERFGPWIYRIATNLAIDALRKRTRRKEESDDEMTEAVVAVRPDDSAGVAARIDKALDSLPEMQRIVAGLYLIEELSYREIAEMTGVAEGTVRSHLSHARKKLQADLKDLYGR